MDTGIVYQKTRKGDDEIKARSAKLTPKLRTMLILIDGSKTKGQLDAVAKKLGIEDGYLALLEGQGLIASAGTAAVAPAAPAGAARPPGAPPADEFERFRAAQRFMNETVVNALGMRSFFFTLKLEKCSTRTDLAGLLEDYEKAVTKGAGADEAAVLVEKARELLG